MFDIKAVGRKISLGIARLPAPAKSASYIWLALSVALFSASAWPQTQLATVFGTITDPTGAVIAEAQVTVSTKSTGLKRVALTDITGRYRLVGLPPGVYTVRAQKENFQPQVIEGIALSFRRCNPSQSVTENRCGPPRRDGQRGRGDRHHYFDRQWCDC